MVQCCKYTLGCTFLKPLWGIITREDNTCRSVRDHAEVVGDPDVQNPDASVGWDP